MLLFMEETISCNTDVSANQRRSLQIITKFKLGEGGSVKNSLHFLLYLLYFAIFVQYFNGMV